MSRIDRAAIERIQKLEIKTGRSILRGLVEHYLNTTPDLLRDMAVNLDQRSYEAAAALAHTLKSSSANLGAREMAEICNEIEEKVDQRADGFEFAVGSCIQRLRASYLLTESEMRNLAFAA